MNPDRELAWHQVLSRFIFSYVSGIVVCLATTPAGPELAGVMLWPLYPLLAVFGFVSYYFYLTPTYTLGSSMLHWLVGILALLPIGFELARTWSGRSRRHRWRPAWIGFPVGFVGTLGVFYTAAASI